MMGCESQVVGLMEMQRFCHDGAGIEGTDPLEKRLHLISALLESITLPRVFGSDKLPNGEYMLPVTMNLKSLNEQATP